MSSENDITFYCEKCTAGFVVSNEKIGKQFLCNKCHNPLTVPAQNVEKPAKNPSTFRQAFHQTKRIVRNKVKKQKAAPKAPVLKTEREAPKSSFREAFNKTKNIVRDRVRNVRKGGRNRRATRKSKSNIGSYIIIMVVLVLSVGLFIFVNNQPKNNSNTNLAENDIENDTENENDGETSSKENFEKKADLLLKRELAKFPEETTTPYAEIRDHYESLFPQLAGTKAFKKLKTELDKLQERHFQKAEVKFEHSKKLVDKLIKQAKNTDNPNIAKILLDEANRLWNSFPDEYIDTPSWNQKNEELKRILTIKRESIGENDVNTASSGASSSKTKKDLESIKNIAYLLDNSQVNDWNIIEGKWGVKDEALVGISQEEEGHIQLGEITPQNFELSFEVKVEKGFFRVHLHRPLEQPSTLAVVTLKQSPELDSNSWIPVKLSCKNKVYKAQVNQSPEYVLVDIKEESIQYSTSGTITLGCEENSKVHYRNVALTPKAVEETSPTPEAEVKNKPEKVPTKPEPFDPAKFHCKLKEKDGKYSFEYRFEDKEELQDFQMDAGNNFTLEKRTLSGKGYVTLKNVAFSSCVFECEFYKPSTPFEAGILIGLRDFRNYYALTIDPEILGLSFVECEDNKKYSAEQSVSLNSYLNKSKNKIKITIKNNETEIEINGNVAFLLTTPIPAGSIGFFGKNKIKIGKLKITGKIDQ